MTEAERVERAGQDATNALAQSKSNSEQLATLAKTVDVFITSVSGKFERLDGKIDTASASLASQIRNAETNGKPNIITLVAVAGLLFGAFQWINSGDKQRAHDEMMQVKELGATDRSATIERERAIAEAQKIVWSQINSGQERLENRMDGMTEGFMWRYFDEVKTGNDYGPEHPPKKSKKAK